MFEFIIFLVLFILVWHSIGWLVVSGTELIESKRIKSAIKKLDDLADKWEAKSPYLALLIFFGPLGLLYKKSLYGK
jgi:hypothetical protein